MRRGLRISGPNQWETKKLSLRLKPYVWQAVSESMQRGNYNLKQRSKWVSEAVITLADMWERDDLSSRDITVCLNENKPPVANIAPVKVTLDAISAGGLSKSIAKLSDTKFRDLNTRIVYTAILKRLSKEGIELRPPYN